MKASKSKPSGCLLPVKSRGIIILILIRILGKPEQKQNHTMH